MVCTCIIIMLIKNESNYSVFFTCIFAEIDYLSRFRHRDNQSITKQYLETLMRLPVNVPRCEALDLVERKFHSLKVSHTDNPARKCFRTKRTKKTNVSNQYNTLLYW